MVVVGPLLLLASIILPHLFVCEVVWFGWWALACGWQLTTCYMEGEKTREVNEWCRVRVNESSKIVLLEDDGRIN